MVDHHASWRDFICDPSRSGRHLGRILGQRYDLDSTVADMDAEALASLIALLPQGDARLLAQAVSLCSRECLDLGGFLDGDAWRMKLATGHRDAVVGPALRGMPSWGRTYVDWSTGAMSRDRFHVRLPYEDGTTAENRVLRWAIDSMSDGLQALAAAARDTLPRRLARLHASCSTAARRLAMAGVPRHRMPGPACLARARRREWGVYPAAAAVVASRAALESHDAAARLARTRALISGSWMAPVDADDLFELYGLVLVLDVLERELGMGPPVSLSLAIGQREHVAEFACGVRVYYDRSPATALGAPTRYRSVRSTHLGLSGAPHRPDIIVSDSRGPRAGRTALVELKRTSDRGYMSESVYKALAYVHDFAAVWPVGAPYPRVILLAQGDVVRRPGTAPAEVAVVRGDDRPSMVLNLASSLGIDVGGPGFTHSAPGAIHST